MDSELRTLVEQIHASGRRVVLAVTGGGSGAIAELLRVPGGSHTLLEAVVPYSLAALTELLGQEPAHACSSQTAAAMAQRALERAHRLADNDAALVGLGVTASLATDRPKRGEHRCHIAAARDDGVEVVSIVLQKGRRDRAAEEDLVARAAIFTLAAACAVSAPDFQTLLEAGEKLTREHLPRGGMLAQLLSAAVQRVTVLPDGQFVSHAPLPRCVLAGSFNPLHAGHIALEQVAAEVLGGPIAFELSVINVDKPPLSATELRRRLAQFASWGTVELTRAATFVEKARVLPGVTFVVGADTAARIVDPKYYGDSDSNMFAALQEIARLGCRVLVAGRRDEQGRFRTLAELGMPQQFQALFAAIPESRFRIDLSSTELRARDKT
jgi:nicotinamide mononucleotide (NMN) deamidase PncC